MAKQKGIIHLEGTLDGINFYMRKGVPVARKAGGGFTGNAIKNLPSMVRVRENSSEFGRCSQIKRLIKDSLFVLIKDHKDVSLHGRMMRLMQEIKTLDLVSERGKRAVGLGLQTNLGKQLFLNFLFTDKVDLKNVTTTSVDPTTLLCTITWLNAPFFAAFKNATHIKFTYLVCSYDFDALTFVSYESSVFLEITNNSAFPFTLNPDLPLVDLNNVLCFFGFQFYQEIGGQKVVLKNLNSIGVSCVHLDF